MSVDFSGFADIRIGLLEVVLGIFGAIAATAFSLGRYARVTTIDSRVVVMSVVEGIALGGLGVLTIFVVTQTHDQVPRWQLSVVALTIGMVIAVVFMVVSSIVKLDDSIVEKSLDVPPDDNISRRPKIKSLEG